MSTAATTRLRRDYAGIKKEPPPYITAAPLEHNILEWRYVIIGPPNTPYEGGVYQGKLKFPSEFPFKPPSIYMITPNGRFKTDTRLCLSMSDFHPGTWQPSWTVSSILTGLLSFMLEDTPTTGSIETSASLKRALAVQSHAFNLKDAVFLELFPEIADAIRSGKIALPQTTPVLSPQADQKAALPGPSDVGAAAQVPLESVPSLKVLLLAAAAVVAAYFAMGLVGLR